MHVLQPSYCSEDFSWDRSSKWTLVVCFSSLLTPTLLVPDKAQREHNELELCTQNSTSCIVVTYGGEYQSLRLLKDVVLLVTLEEPQSRSAGDGRMKLRLTRDLVVWVLRRGNVGVSLRCFGAHSGEEPVDRKKKQ